MAAKTETKPKITLLQDANGITKRLRVGDAEIDVVTATPLLMGGKHAYSVTFEVTELPSVEPLPAA